MLAAALARIIARHPRWLAASGLVFIVACAAVLASRQSFDSDILNLLPSDRPAVEGLKVINSRFAQARELTFVIQSDSAETTAAVHAELVARLRQEPWVVRVLDGPPGESESGVTDLQAIVIPLLLNLPPDDFRAAIATLNPEALNQRMLRLRRGWEAGAPAAIMEIESDPLGLLAQALRPIFQSVSMTEGMTTLSPDGKTQIIPVVTNQPELSAEDCRTLMADVRTFMRSVVVGSSADVRLQVTGRSAYVDEISSSMKRDIQITSIVSLLAVTGLFWFSFRQVLPLIGLSIILAASALAALAAGSLVFAQLNMIAIGFCSILFGLGDDFGLLLIERFRVERRAGQDFESAVRISIAKLAPGILWVAATTSIGFMALALSGSVGFSQLGAMVAIGVFACAGIVTAYMFLFVSRSASAVSRDPAAWSERVPEALARGGKRLALGSSLVLGVLALVAVVPVRPLEFDTSPTSMEPHDAPAAIARATIMADFPAAFEPVMIVGEFPDSGAAALASRKLDAHLETLRSSGVIDGFSSPSSLLVDPSHAKENGESLDVAMLGEALKAWEQAITDAGFEPEAFTSSRSQIQSLIAAAGSGTANAFLSDVLPASSSWHFLLDRMVADRGEATITFIKPSKDFTGPDRAAALEGEILRGAPDWMVTGWSQMLGMLVPWAERELVTFGGAVAGMILVILAIVYRDVRLWLVHALGLLLALLATVATLKLTGQKINLLNVLAFPLLLAVGVDYGIHLILALRNEPESMASVIKPVTISGLSTAAGFGSLALASNPSLSGLGSVCAIGVLWSLAVSLCFVLPTAAWVSRLASPRRINRLSAS
ncbi:MAG: MMPL family transporter [Chthoniobacterales bacterium]